MKKRTLLLTLAALLAATTISANNSLPFTAAVKENGMWGAVNGAGQVVIPISYDRLGLSLSEADEQEEDLASEEGRDDLIEAEKGGLRGFFTRTGKEVIPISYESRSIWKEGALAVRGNTNLLSEACCSQCNLKPCCPLRLLFQEDRPSLLHHRL